MNNLFSSEGRISRSTFWKFYAVFYAYIFLVGFLNEIESFPEIGKIVLGLLLLPLALLGIIVQIKRWHDRDKSGWWVLINFVPCIGGLWSLIECGFLKGTDGPNQYGPDPLQTPVA
jgi:uncharacterized membrane protein YhaH (DUF805 family)